jgi:hypothetical protein
VDEAETFVGCCREAEAHKTYTARLHDTLRIHGSGAPTHLKNYVYFTHNKSFDPAPDAVLPPAISSQLTKQELLRLGCVFGLSPQSCATR